MSKRVRQSPYFLELDVRANLVVRGTGFFSSLKRYKVPVSSDLS